MSDTETETIAPKVKSNEMDKEELVDVDNKIPHFQMEDFMSLSVAQYATKCGIDLKYSPDGKQLVITQDVGGAVHSKTYNESPFGSVHTAAQAFLLKNVPIFKGCSVTPPANRGCNRFSMNKMREAAEVMEEQGDRTIAQWFNACATSCHSSPLVNKDFLQLVDDLGNQVPHGRYACLTPSQRSFCTPLIKDGLGVLEDNIFTVGHDTDFEWLKLEGLCMKTRVLTPKQPALQKEAEEPVATPPPVEVVEEVKVESDVEPLVKSGLTKENAQEAFEKLRALAGYYVDYNKMIACSVGKGNASPSKRQEAKALKEKFDSLNGILTNTQQRKLGSCMTAGRFDGPEFFYNAAQNAVVSLGVKKDSIMSLLLFHCFKSHHVTVIEDDIEYSPMF